MNANANTLVAKAVLRILAAHASPSRPHAAITRQLIRQQAQCLRSLQQGRPA